MRIILTSVEGCKKGGFPFLPLFQWYWASNTIVPGRQEAQKIKEEERKGILK
jgi:hypothetical protein